MTIEETQLLNKISMERWIEREHPDVLAESTEYAKFVEEVSKRNDGVFGRGTAILNGRDFYECWEQANS
ncbi:MAG: hypothetical protein IJ727_01600 [Treponema sp.]|nr:hypothetical protein [Treponema sp.]